MAAAISRFLTQKAEIESNSKELGFEMGANFILQEADLPVARGLARVYHDTRHGRWEMWECMVGVLRSEWEETICELRDTIQEGDLDFDEFAEGFLQGVMDVWPKIEAELD